MGKTIIEKIISSHTDEEVKPGNIVWIELDVISARDFGGPNVVKNYEREYGDVPVAKVNNTFFTFDLVAPAKNIKYAINQEICRNFAKKQGIKVYDIDAGIGTHVLIEEGKVGPGDIAVGTDSHYNILGAIGAFGQGMGDIDIAYAFRTGKTWFEIPETIKVNIKGLPAKNTSPKDLTLYILKKLGTKEALGKAIEFYGEAVERLSLHGRITLCSMVTEMAGIVAFIPMSESVKKELKTFNPDMKEQPKADSDAKYSKILEIVVEGIGPQVASPPHPHNVFDVAELKNVGIESAFIGSCTNGRYEDIVAAAKILKGRKIPEGIRFSIVPATRKIYGKLLKEGILFDLFDAGVIVSNASCGGCAEGHIGLTGEGEIQITTGNRNFPGKQGKGETYLASPEIVTASALLGRIGSPEELN